MRFVTLLPLFAVLAGAFFLPSSATGQKPAAVSSGFRISLSVSPFTELVLSTGLTFTDGKTTASSTADLQRLFMKYGANEVYARIATSRTYRTGFGDHSLERGLARASLARELNLPLNPELGLFDIYGDVRCQPSPDFHEYPELKLPGPWVSLKLEQMLPVLRSYGAIVAKEILKTGVKVHVWDLGNEVEFGVAGVAVQPLPGGCDDTAGGAGWYRAPDAVDPAIGKMSVMGLFQMKEPERIAWLETHLWPHMARMFAAVVAGVRSVDSKARFSTHVSGVTAVMPAQAVAFFKAMKDGGYVPDELGFSFYPSSSERPPRRLDWFKETVGAAHRALGRPVFIAEFGYPAALMTEGPFADWNHAVEKYPITPAGQAAILHDLAAWGPAVDLTGIRPWAPDAPVPGWAPMALFSRDGNNAVSRPGLAAIAEGRKSIKP
jgi:glycosyl hydrolase family 53